MTTAQLYDPPVVLPLKKENIPSELKNLHQWIGWAVGKQKSNGKYEKIPVNVRAKPCNAHISANWMNFDVAVRGYENEFFAGIGFVLNGETLTNDLGKNLFLIGIDIDHCVIKDSAGNFIISDEIYDVREQLSNTYLEISPSGTGVRMFVYSKQRVESSSADGREVYVDKRYLTLTGHSIGSRLIKETTDEIIHLHKIWFPKKHNKPNLFGKTVKSTDLVDSSNDIENNIRSALSYIPADISYEDWRNILWAIKSSELVGAEEIAREWSMTASERYEEDGFDVVWSSFEADRGITLNTLYFHARQAGWIYPSAGLLEDDEGDILNGKLYAEENRGKQLFIHETGDLLVFRDYGWAHAQPGLAEISAKKIVKALRNEAAETFKLDPLGIATKRKLAHASKSSLEPRLKSMISMAQSEPGMTVRLSDFDSVSHLLGVQNGILDLQTSSLLNPSSAHLISMRANAYYIRGSLCPNFIDFLNSVQKDKAVQRLLQQLVGAFISGEMTLQKLIIIYGLGANGKSTFIEIISWLLGDYSVRIATEMLMNHQRSPQGPSPDIVSLKGKRLAYCNEVEEGRRLDEARVKELTGGDTLTGRTPYAKHNVTFIPSHNLVMVGNHKPEIHDMSHGMWRRILLVPFDITIPFEKQDPKLLDKLKLEANGILCWALAGYRDYQRNGLLIPKCIAVATDGYKGEEDLLGEWLSDHCVTATGASALISDCYKAYRNWALNRGHRPIAQSRLSRRLKDRGFERDPGKRNYLGFELSELGKVGVLGCF